MLVEGQEFNSMRQTPSVKIKNLRNVLPYMLAIGFPKSVRFIMCLKVLSTDQHQENHFEYLIP